MRVWPGEGYPLGATVVGDGVNFALFSEVATRVELCLFDDEGGEVRVDLPEVNAHCWHGLLPDVGPGQRYGYRVHGPYAPGQGHRGNPAKLLVDPYAKAVDGGVRWDDAVYGYRMGGDGDGGPPGDEPDGRDSAPYVPKAVVVDTAFDWGDDRSPRTPMHETVIYEAHVKGLTARHPAVPEGKRGTYAGLAHPDVLDHLLGLGVTAVELLPVQHHVDDRFLVERGLTNYWGYQPIGYLAPHAEYSSAGPRGEQVVEFKQMVQALHAAGIEVILDVVYNHTAEGDHTGPTLAFRGIDNAAYYRLGDDGRTYVDYTGTGNSLNMRHPHVLQLIMDSLRYWVTEMHVDGFRFDLAATLARELHDVDRLSGFFDLIHQDPVVSQVKLIAEPWDLGEGGYQVGNFPPLWSEWNGKYRDTVRDLWRGQPATIAEFAYRFTGSSDLYGDDGRRPMASVNFVTAHDGFTLADLVSYERKHNEANGEGNRDGTDDNRSWNGGVEGPTDDPAVLAVRRRQQRNFLATLLLSQGVPMILGGDELGRTQRGNNNAYGQDNEVSWFDWSDDDERRALLDFTRRLTAFRHRHPVLRRRRFFHGRPIHGSGVSDVAWFTIHGEEMTDTDWSNGFAKSLAVFLNGSALPDRGPHGEALSDDDVLVCFNAHEGALPFVLPPERWGRAWVVELDTAAPDPTDPPRLVQAGQELAVEGRSVVVLVQQG